jgi:hypothetical protein
MLNEINNHEENYLSNFQYQEKLNLVFFTDNIGYFNYI